MEILASRAPWYVAGPIIGLCVIGMLWFTNKPLGALGAYSELHLYARKPGGAPPWRVFFLVGMILGGAISAILAGGLSPTLSYGALDGAFGGLIGRSIVAKGFLLTGAGSVMGFGAYRAGGCTSGHGICGTSYGSPASFASTATFMATAILFTYLLAAAGALS